MFNKNLSKPADHLAITKTCSFSGLKRILTYLRNTMTQERLTNLALLHINHEEFSEIDLDEAVLTFATNKNRRLGFFQTFISYFIF